MFPISNVDEISLIFWKEHREKVLKFLNDVPVEKIGSFEESYLRYMHDEQSELMNEINETANYNDDIASRLKSAVETFKQNHSY